MYLARLLIRLVVIVFTLGLIATILLTIYVGAL